MIGNGLPAALRWGSAAASDRGRIRSINQDACLDRPDLGLWAVADGMGGHRDGARASQAIVEALAALPRPARLGAGVRAVRAALAAVNAGLLDETGASPDDLIGSTVVVLLALGTHAAVLWSGDSRVYRLRAGVLSQLTNDHSQVQALIDAGLLEAEHAEHHPLANVLLRAIGSEPEPQVDVLVERLRPGDRFLLCSDGLFRELPAAEIVRLMSAAPPPDCAAALVAEACARGGRDNVTAVVVELRGGERAGPR